MVTNASLPHSTLKKQVSANNYHRVREAVAAGIVSIVHCGTKYNLDDMGTKPLNGAQHQHLLHNQVVPPIFIIGECKPDQDKVVQSCLVLSILSPLDKEITTSCCEPYFVARLTHGNSDPMHYSE